MQNPSSVSSVSQMAVRHFQCDCKAELSKAGVSGDARAQNILRGDSEAFGSEIGRSRVAVFARDCVKI